MQIKLIFTRKVVHLHSTQCLHSCEEGFWTSEVAYYATSSAHIFLKIINYANSYAHRVLWKETWVTSCGIQVP